MHVGTSGGLVGPGRLWQLRRMGVVGGTPLSFGVGDMALSWHRSIAGAVREEGWVSFFFIFLFLKLKAWLGAAMGRDRAPLALLLLSPARPGGAPTAGPRPGCI